jgi:hypothetical protein
MNPTQTDFWTVRCARGAFASFAQSSFSFWLSSNHSFQFVPQILIHSDLLALLPLSYPGFIRAHGQGGVHQAAPHLRARRAVSPSFPLDYSFHETPLFPRGSRPGAALSTATT